MRAITLDEQVGKQAARAVDLRLVQDELESHRHALRLRRQRETERRADIAALRAVIDRRRHHQAAIGWRGIGHLFPPPPARGRGERLRSEEHTSELQSLMRNSYAVFCLKKKNTKK